jgi:hypothetical protein
MACHNSHRHGQAVKLVINKLLSSSSSSSSVSLISQHEQALSFSDSEFPSEITNLFIRFVGLLVCAYGFYTRQHNTTQKNSDQCPPVQAEIEQCRILDQGRAATVIDKFYFFY